MTTTGARALRLATWTGAALLALLAIAVLILSVFPWGWLKPVIERRLAARLERQVVIGSVVRDGWISLTPTLDIRDVRVAQARWAGAGDLLTLRSARVRFSALNAVFGELRPSMLHVTGARLNLVRDAAGRVNWRADREPPQPRKVRDASLGLEDLNIADAVLTYRDAVQRRMVSLRVAADRRGVRATGRGNVRGAAVTVAVAGAPVIGTRGDWPFRAKIDGDALALNVTGTMRCPLDMRYMTIDVHARANDLKLIDAVIEAGLFGTQAVQIDAHAVHTPRHWSIDRLRGTIGSSAIAGSLEVDKHDGRTKLDGKVVADHLDFDDFASDAGHARALAQERVEGLRLVPNTRINLAKIDDTDGRIAFDIRSIAGGRRPSSLTSMKGIVSIDRQLMRVSPLTIGLKRGTIAATVTVDQRGGKPVPMVTLDLALANSSIAALAGDGGAVDAPLSGRVRLTGPGSTIREAVGHAAGSIGLVAHDGVLPAKVAAMIGFDIAAGLGKDNAERARLRCLVARFDVARGVGRTAPLIIDTSLSQSVGRGTLSFPSETLAVTLTGAPKSGSLLRLPGSVTLSGTIRDPRIVVPPAVKSLGNILKGIGRTITGNQGQLAVNADCAGLAVAALR